MCLRAEGGSQSGSVSVREGVSQSETSGLIGLRPRGFETKIKSQIACCIPVIAKPRLSSTLTQLSLVGCIITVKEIMTRPSKAKLNSDKLGVVAKLS